MRDPSPGVLRDHRGSPDMSHDDFVSRQALREHLVSESLATAVSEAAHGQRPAGRHVSIDAWRSSGRSSSGSDGDALARRVRQLPDHPGLTALARLTADPPRP